MKKLLLSAAAILVLAGIGFYAAGPLGFGPPPMGKVLTAAEKANCGLTAEVTEGPYYVSGTAEFKDGNVNATNLPGTPIQISGHVYQGLDNTKPVAGAAIEIWHTDSSGNYHPNANGAATKYTADQLALRGFIKTDATGAYHFTTIYPGEYTGRTRHIHIKVTPEGGKTLTTQLILAKPGDAISFDDDTVSKGLPNCALLKFDETATPESASFDFRL
ncbi:MAG: hypothetical protein KGO94_08665 [Alphaproteobacteria bacterium]|nr:hypothetical protein [Alphaproteobacteria bacterium]